MKKIMSFLMVITMAVGLSGCGPGGLTNQQAGVALGALGGGLLGSAVGGGGAASAFGAVSGAVIGGLVGGAIGKNMDRTDRLEMQQAMRHDRTTTWRNERTGARYRVEPVRRYVDDGRRCREYRTTV